MKKLLFIFAFLASFLIGQAATIVTDVIKASDLRDDTSYAVFSEKKGESGAVYAGRCGIDGSGNIQINSTSPSGIVTTKSGGKAKKITIKFGTEKQVDIYGKNTAYNGSNGASDLYADTSQGTKIGSLSKSGTLEITKDYEYIGIRSSSGARYITSIEIEWEQEEQGGEEPTCADPVFSVASGDVDAGTPVTISCPTDNAVIFDLQINDESIKEAEEKATYTFVVDKDMTVSVCYILPDGETTSEVITASYKVKKATCADPVFSVASGEVEKGTEVTISCPTPNAVIYDLKINGEDISDAEEKATYTFAVDKDMTVNVIYILDDYETLSNEITATYTVKKATCADPVFSVASDEVEKGTEVTISCPTPNAVIYDLKVNGEDISEAVGQATYTFTVDKDMTVKVTYVLDDYETLSNEIEAKYTVKAVVPEPTGKVEYVLTPFEQLQTGDIVVVVDTHYPYALDPNAASAPKATSVTISNDKITSEVTDNMELKITMNGSGANATFNLEQAAGTTAGYKMYMIANNNGIRFAKSPSGTNTTTFSVDGNYIKGSVGGATRYIGVYSTSPDWRCYTSTTGNIKDTKTAFYKKVIKGDDPTPTTCAAPVFTPAFGEVEAETVVEVTCATEGAKLNLLIKKGDEVVVEEPAAEFPITFTVTEPVSVIAYTYTADDESDKSETVMGNYTVKAVVPVELVKYKLVESASDLTIGDEYIMVYIPEKAVMGPLDGKIHKAVTEGFVLDGNTISVASTSEVLPFVIEEGTAADTYAFKYADGEGNKYIICTSATNGNTGSSSTKIANANLKFTWNATGATIAMVWANNSNNNANKFQYNDKSGSERFTNYKTGSQKDCSLFKRVKPIPETCEVPVFTPALGSEVKAGDQVKVTCNTEGAMLHIQVEGANTNNEEDFEKEVKMPYTFQVKEDVKVTAYAYFKNDNGEVVTKSETVEGEYTVDTTVEGTFAYVEDFAGLNVGDQVVFVSNFGGDFTVSMSSERADGDDIFPAAQEVTLSEDQSEITSVLTSSTIFTIDGIVKDAEGRETYAFTSNIASNQPLYLQYGGRNFLDIKPLATGSEYYFTALKKDEYPVAQLYATSSLSTDAHRFMRANGTTDWRAYQENKELDPAAGRYTKIYKKVEEVEKAATPTFSIERGEVKEGTVVTVTSATKGAYICILVGDQVIDGASPRKFTVNADVDVLAYAYLVDKSGKKILATESETAEASYTLQKVDQSTIFALATDIEPGYDYIIVGKTSTKYGLMGGLSGKYIAEVDVDGNAEMNDGKFIITSDNVARVRFEPAENGKYYVHYKQGATDGYLATVYNNNTNPSKNAKNEVAIEANKDNAKSATVSVGANGRGTIKYDVDDNTSGELGHNGSANPHRFTFYKNANNYDIYLYKCVEGTSPVTYYRSRAILEDADYVIVGAADAGHYVMTGYDSDAKNFGSTHEKSNGDVTMLGGGYHLTVTDKNVAVVNFVKKEAGVMRAEGETAPAAEWAMKLKDGQHIVRGADGEAALSDEADHVTYKIVEGKDGYMAYLVHGGDDAQSFHFDGTSFKSSTEAGTPIYIYATKVPVEGDAMQFADEAPSSVTLTTGYDEDRKPINQTFASVDMPKGEDDFFYIYYNGLATLDNAKNMSDDELSWRYKYNDSDWFKAPADGEQTSKVAMHVEVEMLGDANGENLSYKKADPENPGDWTNKDYIKYNGVNQVYVADTDKPYIKVPAISKYSIVTATATGDNDTHIGDAAATQRVYVRAGDNGTTSIEAVDFDNNDGETVYYNLQGVRVYNPGSGIYIRVQGHNATKVNIVR